jgi:hypothetical protein
MSDNEREKLKQRRRAWIKAAGAAPVVFSLANGSAVAAVSATCDTKPMGTAPGNIVTAPDTWVRQTVAKYDIKIKEGKNTKVVSGFMQNGNYYSISGSLIDPTTVKRTTKNGSVYLLVDYDGSSSTYRAYEPGSTVDNPISGSCWASLNPTGGGGGNIP